MASAPANTSVKLKCDDADATKLVLPFELAAGAIDSTFSRALSVFVLSFLGQDVEALETHLLICTVSRRIARVWHILDRKQLFWRDGRRWHSDLQGRRR